ncbi:MAG: non-canonical purine NTP pyrophosphatase [Gemmatimonadaceae bacterium]
MSGAPWILATRNVGKLRELRALFAEAGIDVVDLAQAGIEESLEEDGIEVYDTFEENAVAKARFFGERAGGRTVVADDSGLEVFALGGEPGVRSRRWCGRSDLEGADLDAANNTRLVERLRGVRDLRATFVCAAAWWGEGGPIVARGEVHGHIVTVPAGADGFGYDPFFFSSDLGCTLGVATLAEKQRVSHRSRAFRALLEALRVRLPVPPLMHNGR